MTTSSRITSDQGVVIMQYLARALFAALAVIYFHHADSFFFALPKATPWLLFAAYVGLQLLLLFWRPANSDAFASGLDLLKQTLCGRARAAGWGRPARPRGA